MKINALNNINFGRAVIVESNTNNTFDEAKEIEKTLNRNRSNTYNSKEGRKIRAFFRDIMEDYNHDNPVRVVRTKDGDTLLLSGEEAKTGNIKELEDGKNGKPESHITFLEAGKKNKVNKINYEYLQTEYSSFSEMRELLPCAARIDNENDIFISAMIYETKSLDLKG
jgi:hypothetical protein